MYESITTNHIEQSSRLLLHHKMDSASDRKLKQITTNYPDWHLIALNKKVELGKLQASPWLKGDRKHAFVLRDPERNQGDRWNLVFVSKGAKDVYLDNDIRMTIIQQITVDSDHSEDEVRQSLRKFFGHDPRDELSLRAAEIYINKYMYKP